MQVSVPVRCRRLLPHGSSPPLRGLVAVLTALCLLVLLIGATATTASAQGSTTSTYAAPDLINLSALEMSPTQSNGTYYAAGIYGATSAQIASLEDLEGTAVSNTLSDHGLPESDYPVVQTWGRADADAELWALLVQAIETTSPTTDQKNAAAWLTSVVVREGILAADDAGLEYTKWAGLGTSAYQSLLAGKPSESALQSFLSGTPLPYTDGANDTDPQNSTDGGYCVYAAPSPDQAAYSSSGVQTCVTPCTNIEGCPPPTPTYQDFIAWGDADASDAVFNNSQFATDLDSVAEAGIAGGTIAAASLGGSLPLTLGTTLAGSSFQTSIFPFAGRINQPLRQNLQQSEVQAETDGASELEADGETSVEATTDATAEAVSAAADAATEAAGFVASSGVGIIVAAALLAISAAVTEGISVVQASELPGQIAATISGAPSSTPNLASILASSGGGGGLYSLFIGATEPDPLFRACDNSTLPLFVTIPTAYCLNQTAIPAQSSTDPQFIVTDKGSSSSTTQPTVTWNDTASGATVTARISGNWFVDQVSSGGQALSTVQSLRLQYTDWSGAEMTAWLYDSDTTPEFLTIADSAMGGSFDPSTCASAGTCALTSSIDLVSPTSGDISVSVSAGAPPPPPTEPPAPPLNPEAGQLGGGNTTTTLTASPSVPEVGQQVTYTAKVTTFIYAGLGDNVTFSNGYQNICASVPLSNDNGNQPGPYYATCTTTYTSPGTTYMFATFSGDFVDPASQAELTLDVTTQQPTSMTLAASPASPQVGQRVTYTATLSVSGTALPTGSVLFTDGSSTICADGAPTGPSGGPYVATCTDTYTAGGAQKVTATYAGDADTRPATASATVQVSVIATSTTLAVMPTSPTVGQQVTYTATVSDTGGPTPSGDVVFKDQSGDVLCTSSLSQSAPHTATCSQTYQSAGSRTVTAAYQGDSATGTSSANATVVVAAIPTATAMTSSPGSPVIGQQVTYTATVTDGSGPAPTGTVTFTNALGAAVCAGVKLTPSAPYTATCTQTYLLPGQEKVGAAYSGDAATAASAGAITIEVGQASTSVALTGSPASPSFGQSVSFTATVSPEPGLSAPAPTGTVTFSVDGSQLGGAVSINGSGQATSAAIDTLAPGSHQVVATYSGDVGYAGSQGALAETVTCSQTVTSESGSLTVSGSTCVEGATVNGPVTVAKGGSLALLGATVSGPIRVSGATSVLVCGSTLSGPLTISSASGPVTLGGQPGSSCLADVFTGPVSISDSTGPVLIGGTVIGGPATLGSDTGGVTLEDATVKGPLSLSDDAAPVTVTGDTIGGPLSVDGVQGSTAAVVSGNTVSGPLSCAGNSPPPVDDSTPNQVSGSAGGQCSGLA